jgi:hypothetical protein
MSSPSISGHIFYNRALCGLSGIIHSGAEKLKQVECQPYA